MEIAFELEREDFWNYRKYRIRHDYWYIPTRFFVLYTIMFCIGYAFYHDIALIAAASLLVALFHLVHNLLTVKSEVNNLVFRHPYWIMPQTVRLHPEKVEWVTNGGNADIPWQQFKALEDIGDYLIFRLKRWRAILIPKQAFISPQEAQAFLRTAQIFSHSALSGTTLLSLDKDAVWPPPPRSTQNDEDCLHNRQD